MTDIESVARWYLALTAVSLALLPPVCWIGTGLGSTKYGLVRPMAVVILTALVWWPAALVDLPFTRWTLTLTLVLAGTASWILWWRRGASRISFGSIAAFEALWLVLFLVYAWFRGFSPDIAYTEKPMEIALLSSVSRSTEAPAPDPWLTGYAINYYYFGYQVISSIVRLSGVPPAIGFNLALATTFASAGTAAAVAAVGLLRNMQLSRPALAGCSLLAVVLLLLAGNLETAERVIRDPSATIDAGWWDGVGWQASRVVVDHGVHAPGDERQTINEFPAFSFILGDLHPHVLTLPLLASVVALAVAVAVHRPSDRVDRVRLSVIGALVGLLYASNSWDAPTGLMLILGALVIASVGRTGRWREAGKDAAIVIAGAGIAALPFVLHFDAPVGVPNEDVPTWLLDIPILGTVFSTFGIVTWRPSSATEILTVHGIWIVAFTTGAIVNLTKELELRARLWAQRHGILVIGMLLFGLAVAWMPAAILVGIPLALAVYTAMRTQLQDIRVVSALFASGFALILVPEVLYIQDVFADRMNTVFKLYFQAWLLLAVASSAAVVSVVRSARSALRPFVLGVIALGLFMVIPYTPLSAHDWSNGFVGRRGLDGERYIAEIDPGAMAAIAWVREHARPGDALVEAPGCSYEVISGVPMNRVSAFSGVPTLVGWLGHEHQWRRGSEGDVWGTLKERSADANLVLDGTRTSTDTAARFIVLGTQELMGSTACDEVTPRSDDVLAALMATGWSIAFEQGSTRVLVPNGDPTLTAGR